MPIYFDGIDQSAYLMRKTDKQPRQVFAYVLSTRLGAIRVNDWKFHWSVQDAWLGPAVPLTYAAVYNLKMDPGEEYDRFMGGSAPTSISGALQTSPGRWQGGDTAWTAGLQTVALMQLNDTFAKYPNIPLIPGGSTIGADVPHFVPTMILEGKLPPAHPAAKEIPTEK